MGCDAVQTCRDGGRVEHLTAPVAKAQNAPRRRREHEVIGSLACHLLGERIDQRARDGHRATLMRLRGAEDGPAADLGDGLGDLDATP